MAVSIKQKAHSLLSLCLVERHCKRAWLGHSLQIFRGYLYFHSSTAWQSQDQVLILICRFNCLRGFAPCLQANFPLALRTAVDPWLSGVRLHVLTSKMEEMEADSAGAHGNAHAARPRPLEFPSEKLQMKQN